VTWSEGGISTIVCTPWFGLSDPREDRQLVDAVTPECLAIS
jgi:hypothetical protein